MDIQTFWSVDTAYRGCVSAVVDRIVNRVQIIFSDLDGTVLDENYCYKAAEAALHAIHALKVPLTFCSSKTRSEIEFWREQLENEHPFITENGGALFIPRNYFPSRPHEAIEKGNYEVIEFGRPHTLLVGALRAASNASGCRVLGFSDMTAAQISRRTGLPIPQAELARKREYDEPFEILGSKKDRLLTEIENLGFRWTRGGRFHHITGSMIRARP